MLNVLVENDLTEHLMPSLSKPLTDHQNPDRVSRNCHGGRISFGLAQVESLSPASVFHGEAFVAGSCEVTAADNRAGVEPETSERPVRPGRKSRDRRAVG